MPLLRLEGVLQYKTLTEGQAARDWLTAWVQRNKKPVLNGSHTLTNIVSDEGCVCQLTLTYRFQVDTLEEYEGYRNEIEVAIYQGPPMGGVAAADCMSTFGATGEAQAATGR